MSNLLLNKTATANNSYAPFVPSRAVDGVCTPESRWVGTVVPGWLSVDMGDNYYVGQYYLAFMSSVGWQQYYNASYHSLKSFIVQGSLDGVNWTNLDSYTNNAASTINKTLSLPILSRFLRVYINQGLNCNQEVSSVVDFQATEIANPPFLTNLVPSTGALSPNFYGRFLNYTINLENTVNNIAFTPTALSGEIKVNGTVVVSGVQSTQITLPVGTTKIPITVTNGSVVTTYNISVIRAGAAAYLENLVVANNRGQAVALVPSFVKETLNYTASQGGGIASVTLTPTAVDSSATILINGVTVPSGSTSPAISLQSGANSITIVVNSTTTYSIVITKG